MGRGARVGLETAAPAVPGRHALILSWGLCKEDTWSGVIVPPLAPQWPPTELPFTRAIYDGSWLQIPTAAAFDGSLGSRSPKLRQLTAVELDKVAATSSHELNQSAVTPRRATPPASGLSKIETEVLP